jgi:molecular chaperone GrpE (heat shock protein)
MQANKQADQSFILSREQQEAIQNFKKEELRVKRELKNVRKNLRKEIEQLGIVVKTVNIALMPLLVSIAGVTYGVLRRRRETR